MLSKAFKDWRTCPASLKTKAFRAQAKTKGWDVDKVKKALATHFTGKELTKMYGERFREVILSIAIQTEYIVSEIQ